MTSFMLTLPSTNLFMFLSVKSLVFQSLSRKSSVGVGATWNHLGTFLGCLFYWESSLKHCSSNITADTYGVGWRISLKALRISTGHCIDSLGFGESLCGEYKVRPLQRLLVFWAHKVSFLPSTENSILFLSRFRYSSRRSRWLPVQPW